MLVPQRWLPKSVWRTARKRLKTLTEAVSLATQAGDMPNRTTFSDNSRAFAIDLPTPQMGAKSTLGSSVCPSPVRSVTRREIDFVSVRFLASGRGPHSVRAEFAWHIQVDACLLWGTMQLAHALPIIIRMQFQPDGLEAKATAGWGFCVADQLYFLF